MKLFFLNESGGRLFVFNVCFFTGLPSLSLHSKHSVGVPGTPPVPSMQMGISRGRFPSLLLRGSVEGGGGLGARPVEVLVANNPILFKCLTGSVLCAEQLQARLGPGLAVCFLLAGQVVGSTALSVVCGQG